jgi:hypothetical protein
VFCSIVQAGANRNNRGYERLQDEPKVKRTSGPHEHLFQRPTEKIIHLQRSDYCDQFEILPTRL